MTRRRKSTFVGRCWQGIAAPAALAAVAFGIDGAWHLLGWLVRR